MTFAKGDPNARAGRARMKELAQQNLREAAELRDGLLRELQRPATVWEEEQAAQIALVVIRIRRSAEQGRRDVRNDQLLLARLTKASPWAAQPAD